ncbi:hypothetical protein QKW35_09080 [Pontibacterium granulatum]|uniref:hypothetical protein n=1 Tax=Pontibacterium granulatum TaxID=2036029 RepID=UPI00249A46AF|nr:hypothetical protein [Pontibacterium granulatum]MDI3324527.1 hypothetical protein [Pontibacterium granulatum]
MNQRYLPLAFLYAFLIVCLVFMPSYSLDIPLSKEASVIWLAIFLLFLKFVITMSKVTRQELFNCFSFVKGRVFSMEMKTTKVTNRLLFAGGACWFLILFFKETLFPLPLFVLGSILFVWGLSRFLEENSVYRFSESYISNRWLLGGLSSFILYWAGFNSASQINSMFGVDPGFFPFTISAMVFYNVAVILFLLMIPVFFVSSSILVAGIIKDLVNDKDEGRDKREDGDEGNVYAVLISIVVFSAYASVAGLIMLSPNTESVAVKSIAMKTDFNSKHYCKGEHLKDKSVIFIGPNSNVVLAEAVDNSKQQFSVQKCVSL